MSIDVDLFNQKLRDKDEEIARLLEENKKLRNDASTDVLTNLPNRRQLLAFLDEFQSLFERGVIECYNVVAFDLDGFKPINDMYGHAAGDACLRFVAEEVLRVLRTSDFFAREGGDEFAILLPGIKEDMAVRVAKKVLLVIEEGVNTRLRALLKSDDIHVSASFGVVSLCKDKPGSRLLIEEILKLADYVRYVTKQNGKGGVLTLEQARTIDKNDAIWTNFKA
jgi:diguanylate cyclase